MNKFKVGDKVRTASGIDGTITKIDKLKIYVTTVYGTELTYKEEELKFRYPDLENKPRLNYEYVGDKCPRCRTPWTITTFGSKKWYHCKPCNKKAEDLILGNSAPTSLPKDSSSGESSFIDDLDDWDAFLKAIDSDAFDPWSV